MILPEDRGPRCPRCKSPLPPQGSRRGPPTSVWPHFPFCSKKCRAIDLGRWFDGSYTIPGAPVDPEDLPAEQG